MTPGEFAATWRGISTSERAAAQSHFIDLCRVLGEPAPTDVLGLVPLRSLRPA